jgi:tRNA (guanine-N7-)-methyltransferase
MRSIPDAADRIARSACHVTDPIAMKGKWREHLNVTGPLHVEIGSGRGRFIITMANLHPGTAFVAIERFASILAQMVRNIPDGGLANLGVVYMDAHILDECFAPGEIDRIYLNFSDPWSKTRYEKRRLTSRSFLDLYRIVLSEHGDLQFKTDNADFFEYSLESFPQAGWNVDGVTRDYHAEAWSKGSVMTEYEEKFRGLGHPIHRLTAKPYRKDA